MRGKTLVARWFCPDCNIYTNDNTKKAYCPECNKPMVVKCVDKNAVVKKPNVCRVDELMVDRPRYSDALGVNPDQIPDFKKRWPWMDFDKEGRCLIRNRADKLRHLKVRGFVELE